MDKTSGNKIHYSMENFVITNQGKYEDKYRKIQELGYGAFSKVFRVQNTIDHKCYAMKELILKKITDIFRFKAEINIMSKCDHPNIVKLYEVYGNSRHMQLIMEECIGGALFDRLIKKMENGEIFTEQEVVVIFKQLMSAISYCHSRGICHRDLKPENILFLDKGPNSKIKITDFGLSLIFDDCDSSKNGEKLKKVKMSTSLGTPHFVSPEVLEGNYTQKCDIWSAGVILYLLLSGLYPFTGNNDSEIYASISKKKFTYPEREWSTVSSKAKDLINHMLCDEKKRYTAEQVLSHSWMTESTNKNSNALKNLNINNLKIHKNRSDFKKFMFFYLASRLEESDLKNLRKIFEEIDKNKDGTISIKEFKIALQNLKDDKGAKLSEKEINEIFKGIDVNNSNKIDFNEYISAVMEQSTYFKEEKIIDAFKMLDKDNSGKITKEEIRLAIKDNTISDYSIRKFIKGFDLDGDGEIDILEFVANMSKFQ